MKFNINDIARVTLSSYGLGVINLRYSHLGIKLPEIKNNILEAPVWYLMHLFGPYLFMGTTADMVFENNEIEIIRSVR